MIKLNLPAYDCVVKEEDGKVFILDQIRKKYLVLTPEEWVRQHFINYLITDLKYPKALMKIEGGLTFNKLSKRSDIVVFNRDGQPWMVVECKSPSQKLSQSTVHQASVYNYTLKARYLTVTNGMEHICCEVNWSEGKTAILKELPAFN